MGDPANADLLAFFPGGYVYDSNNDVDTAIELELINAPISAPSRAPGRAFSTASHAAPRRGQRRDAAASTPTRLARNILASDSVVNAGRDGHNTGT